MFEITDEEKEKITTLSDECRNMSYDLQTKTNEKFKPFLKILTEYDCCCKYEEQEKLEKETVDLEENLFCLKRSYCHFGMHIGNFIIEDAGFEQNIYFIVSKRLFGGYNVKRILSWMGDHPSSLFVTYIDYKYLPHLEELFLLLKEAIIRRKKNALDNVIEKKAMTDLMLDKITF